VFYKGGPTSVIVPQGVSLKGENLESRGQEPRTKASIYQTKETSFKVEIEGSGELKRGKRPNEAERPQIQFVCPSSTTKCIGCWLILQHPSARIYSALSAGQPSGVKKK